MNTLMRLFHVKSGATAIEYGLLASLISIGIIAGLGSFSDSLLKIFQIITTTIAGAGTA